jgi:hypothetical protein
MSGLIARSYRFDRETLELLRLLARRLGASEVAVLRLAVRRLARAERVKVAAGE